MKRLYANKLCLFIVFDEQDGYVGNINHLSVELAFGRRVCECHVWPTFQMVAAVRDVSRFTKGFPIPSFGTKLLGGESNVTFVKT